MVLYLRDNLGGIDGGEYIENVRNRNLEILLKSERIRD
jgi:hypothetical protein